MKDNYKTRQRIANWTLCVVGLAVSFLMLVPFAWMLSASFKNNMEIYAYPIKWVPEFFRLDNYRKVWVEINFPRYFLNSLKLSSIITAAQLVTCSLAAYSFSKLRFPGRDKIFVLYLATMMVPWHAIMIPQFIVVKTLNLYDSHLSLIMIQSFSAFGVFLLRQNMLSIPGSLHEAAKIDGCGSFRTYWSIILPLTKTGLATLTVLTFNGIWNDYLGPMLYLDSDKNKTVQVALAGFKQEYSADYGAIMAGTVCSIIPIILVYVFAQKYIVEGVAFSGLKG
ncbi:MAG: carbohydrate ABC transporter permease [Clostridiales bacterium]|jgi:multiple sugar transport system permease protein|nr:carbohydrate ABC transporter permease [Clostridiales bacterium]MDR2750273.1 carbohydrate ABC transporter permease [Clostridiales bacterium]